MLVRCGIFTPPPPPHPPPVFPPSPPFNIQALSRTALASLHAASKCADQCGMQLLLLDTGDGDNTIYLDEARTSLQRGPTLVLLPVRLGMHTIDSSYIQKVEHVFSFRQSVGFIGGRPVCVCVCVNVCVSAYVCDCGFVCEVMQG